MKNSDLPAMPNYDLTEGGYLLVTSGLTKREYFAGLAMQGILSNHCLVDGMDSLSIEWVAIRSASIADALLSELEITK